MEQTPSLKDKINSESPFSSGIMVPLLILGLSILIIAGISKMLTHDKGYVTLVEELRDKTFGNRWVAAFELSKYLSNSKIPAEDIPWLEKQLLDIYTGSSSDPRTKHFLVLAAGSLRGDKSLEMLQLALKEKDPEILFGALSSISKWESLPANFNFEDVLALAGGSLIPDEALQHTALVVLTMHSRQEVIPLLQDQLTKSDSKNLRDVSAIALMYFNRWDGLSRIKELLVMPYELEASKSVQGSSVKPVLNQSLLVEANKLNIIQAAKKLSEKKIPLPLELLQTLEEIEKNDRNIQVKTRAKEVLLTLKN
jgi:hypothetical protein